MYTEMHAVRGAGVAGRGRYSAKNMAKPVNFYCLAPGAKEVFLVGDFNQWKVGASPMVRQPDGTWHVVVAVTHGHHHYAFLVDGRMTLDPRATGVARNERNERVSLLSVS